MTPCYCGTLGGLSVLVGSLTYPSPARMFEPSCFGRLLYLEAGLTSWPLLALPGLCLMPDLWSRQPAPEASSDRHRWLWPCLPRFRLLLPLAFAVCWVVFMSGLVPYLHPSTDDGYDLPDLTLDLTILQYSSWVLACASTPCGVFVLCLCLCSLLALNFV